jgi:hypothetical protein
VTAWVLRPIVWFTAASMLTTIVHELTHASVAYVLGVRSTLFNYFAELDRTQPDVTMAQRAVIGVSGPVFCLALGVVAWLVFKRTRTSGASLPFLYFTVFGIGTFFGNLMSIAFVGDFSNVARVMDLPMGLRYALAVAGGLSAAAIHFWAGRQLVQWVPAGVGRFGGAIGIVAVPAILGTAVVILVNQPTPGALSARFAEAAFWLFAMLGALTTRGLSSHAPLAVRWLDGVVVIIAVVIVRVMVHGIAFTP